MPSPSPCSLDPYTGVTLTVTVNGAATPGFTISATPTTVSLAPGAISTIAITATRTGGFTGAIDLTVQGLPAGVTGTFSPTALTGTQTTSTLTLVAAGSAAAATSALTIRANSAGQSERTASVALTVTSGGGATVAFTLNTRSLTVGRGQHGWLTALVTANTSSNGTITNEGVPAGVTFAWTANSDTDPGQPTGSFSTSNGAASSVRIDVSPTAQLGTSTITIRATPTGQTIAAIQTMQLTVVDPQGPNSPAWLQIAVDAQKVCGIRADNKTYCWGSRVANGGSFGDRGVPTVLLGENLFTRIAVGDSFCALHQNTSIYCWGSNSLGQLGDGSSSSQPVSRDAPNLVVGGRSYFAVSSGGEFACGLASGGAAFCWGSQVGGKLGDGVNGTSNGQFVTSPVAVRGGLSFASIVAGGNDACALTANGSAFCWGVNQFGELGDGTKMARPTPVAVTGSLSFEKIDVGSDMTCGITAQGALYCWGSTGDKMGLNPVGVSSILTPTRVGGSLTFTDVSIGDSHMCAVSTSGTAYCGGANDFGGLGNGTTTRALFPQQVSGSVMFRSIAAGGGSTCGISTSGQAFCWGYNLFGQVGDGTRVNRFVPTPVQTF